MLVRIVLRDGHRVAYGPCRLPAPIRRLADAMSRLYVSSELARRAETARYDALIAGSRPTRLVLHPPPTRITGGMRRQRALLRALAARLGAPGVTRLRLTRENGKPALFATAAEVSERSPRSGWSTALALWTADLLVPAYNRRAAQAGLPVLQWAESRDEGDVAGRGRPGRIDRPALEAALARITQRQSPDRLVFARVRHLDAPIATVVLRSRDPAHADRGLDRLGAILDRVRRYVLVVENPCGAPVMLEAGTASSGTWWGDAAWLGRLSLREGIGPRPTPPPHPKRLCA